MPVGLLIFFTLINLLNYFDRYIVNAVEPLLHRDFALSNTESGLAGAAFVLGYATCSPLFGYLGDRFDRRALMVLGLLAWSIFTGLTGLVSGFYTFLVVRMVVGVGEASFSAIVPGYLKSRVTDTIALNSALSLFYAAIPVGSALGYVVGAAVAERFGWRALFGSASLPGMLLALGFYFVARDGRESVPVPSQHGFLPSIKLVLASRVLRLTILGYIFNTFALNGVALFVVRYGSSLGMEIGAVGKIFGILLVCAGFIGTLGGGRLASWYARQKPGQLESLLLFVSISTFIGVPFLGIAFLVKSPELFFVACFLAELALFAGVAPLNSVIVERAPEGLETFTQGLTIFSIQLFGSALAPIFIGKLADILANGFLKTPSANGAALGYALQLSTVAMVLSAGAWLLATRAERGERQRSGGGKLSEF